MQETKQLLIKILLKKAKGYRYKEKTEEFNIADGDETLVKRKVVTKQMQPDVAAVKALLTLSESEAEVSQMTDEQLQVEKLRLMQLLNICDQTPANSEEDSAAAKE